MQGDHDRPEAIRDYNLNKFMAAVLLGILRNPLMYMRHPDNDMDTAFSANSMLSVIFQIRLLLTTWLPTRLCRLVCKAKHKSLPRAVSAQDPTYNEKNANQRDSLRGVAGCNC